MVNNAVEYLVDQPGYTDILANNGYTCGISGKWHLGHSSQPQKSFSHWYVHQKGSSHYHNAPMIREGELVQEPEYVTDLITDDALNFIDKHAEDDNPFYISVHYTAPHQPWIDEHPEEYVSLYEDCPFTTCPQGDPHPHSMYHYSEEDARECLKGYFAAVTALDAGVGRIIKKLDKLDLREDTLVCFLSDNGFNCGHHGIWGKGNGTYPMNMYDTSVKVPAIFSHPGQIPQGVVSEAMVSGYDFMPTLLDYLGLAGSLQNLQENKLPGNSFKSELINKAEADNARDNVVVYDEYGPVRMIRTREWKYVHRYPEGPHELYHLTVDPAEEDNLHSNGKYKEIVKSLKTKLEDWFDEYVNPEYDGKDQPVTGNGQLQPVTATGNIFDQGRQVVDDPQFDPGMEEEDVK